MSPKDRVPAAQAGPAGPADPEEDGPAAPSRAEPADAPDSGAASGEGAPSRGGRTEEAGSAEGFPGQAAIEPAGPSARQAGRSGVGAGDAGRGLRPEVGRAGGTVPPGMKALVVVALVTVCCAGLNQVQNMVAPAFFALTLVLTVRPIHRWLVRKGLPPWLSGLSTMAALAAVLLGTVGLTVWSLVGLPDTLSKYKGSFEDIVRQLRDLAAKYDFDFDTAKLQDELLKNLDFDRILEMVSTLVNYLTSAGSLIALIALAMLFITVDTMTMDFRSRVLANHDSSLHEALCGFEGRVRQYWLVSTIFGIIVAVIDGIVLWFLDVPLPVAWVMVSFITNYIPNIGFVMGVIPPAVMALVDSGWVTAVWVIALYSIINFVIQGIFQPKITGDAVGLSTTITFLSLIFWTVVIGPLGAILAVPLTLFAKAVLVDSSPATRWLEVFLIPESEAKKRSEHGIYDEENPAADDFVDFMEAELGEQAKARREARRRQARKGARRQSLLRQTERQPER